MRACGSDCLAEGLGVLGWTAGALYINGVLAQKICTQCISNVHLHECLCGGARGAGRGGGPRAKSVQSASLAILTVLTVLVLTALPV